MLIKSCHSDDDVCLSYSLGSGLIGMWPMLRISRAEFSAAKTAQRNITRLLGIEEKFQMLIDNYLDYERDSLNLALSRVVSDSLLNWPEGQDALRLMNRRVGNCLSAARLYLDQSMHDLSVIYGKDSDAWSKINQSRRSQYAGLLGYRVMEAIRNSFQHRLLLVSEFDCRSRWEDRVNGLELLHHRFVPILRREELRNDEKFKKAVLDELDRSGQERIEISPLLRQYVDGLGQIHRQIRCVTSTDSGAWKRVLIETLAKYGDAAGKPIRVVVARQSANGLTTDQVPIVRDVLDRFDQFHRVSPPTNIFRRMVSNEASGLSATANHKLEANAEDPCEPN